MKLSLCAGAIAAMAISLAASAQPAMTPHLVAVGGALKDDNEAVYAALLARRETNTIVIVPYSSADAPAAAESVIAAFKKRRPDATYKVMPDSSKDDQSRKAAAEM